MTLRPLRTVAGLIVVGIAWSAWTLAVEGAAVASPGLDFPTLAEDATPGTGAVQPCLDPLPGAVVCGRFRVWENRDTEAGRTIDLAFVVAKALELAEPSRTAITYFFGGPGSVATGRAELLVPSWEAHRRRRDMLFVDFRGVGHSGALDCHVPYPGGVASRFGTVFPVDHLERCRDHLSQRAQLDQYTSNRSMDDLDELRRWLGYDQLDLWGGSYGTVEAQVFLRRHGEATRSVVLNGVAPISEPIYLTHARGLQGALDLLIAECAASTECAKAYPEFRRTVDVILSGIAETPRSVVIDGETVKLGAGDLGYALRGLLYSRAAEIPALLDAVVETGDWQPLADYYAQRQAWVAEAGGTAGYHFSVLCAEDIAPLTDQQVATASAGTFLGDHLIGGYRRACELWPYARLPPDFWQPVESEVPALLLSGERDPVTAPSGGDVVGAHLPNSLHLIVPNGGHGVGGDCIDDLVVRFLDQGSVEGLDASCIAARPPTQFRLPG